MTSRLNPRISFIGKAFLQSGLNVTDNPLIVGPQEMVEANNILIGATPARKKRGGQAYFNTDGSDATANYPLNPKNNGGTDGDPILGALEFWRYDFVTGAPKSTKVIRQGTKFWGIDSRTGVATDLTGGITSLQSTGSVTFQTFEGKVYWASTNALEGYYCWDGMAASATEILNGKASFVGAIVGVTGSVSLQAVVGGSIGNNILLTGDGATSLDTLITNWNAANPTNTVLLLSANGADTPANAEAMQLGGGLQKLPPDGTPSVLVSHNGRMFAFGVPGFPYRVYASKFYDATAWAVNVFGATGSAAEPTSLDVDPFGDPKGIVGAASFQGRLYVFLRRALFEIRGFTINDFVVRTISKQIGAVSHKSIVVIENDIIYASERGILRLSSTDKAIESDFAFLSRPISKIWNKLLNRNIDEFYSAAYDETDNLYLLSVASKNSNKADTILAYSVQSNLWMVWDNHQARNLSTYVVDGVNRVVAGREDGVLALLGDDVRKDLDKPFSAKFRTGILFPNGQMDTEHVFKNVTLLASTDGVGVVTLNVYVDSKLITSEALTVESGRDLLGSSFVLGQSLLGGGKFIPATYRIGAKGYGLQLEVLFDTEDEVEIYGFMVEAVAADHRIAGGA